MITKAEVQKAIAACEVLAGSPLDRTTVRIERGDLTVLLETAKTAKYRNIAKSFAPKEFVLDDGSPIIGG